MRITLISRFFDQRLEGIGSYSNVLKEGLEKCKNIHLNTVSQDDYLNIGNPHIDTLYFSFLKIPSLLNRESDIYHALSPLESIRLNKKKLVVTIYDLMPITIPHIINKNKLFSLFAQQTFKIAIKSALKCEKIITISEESARSINEHYGTDLEDITVIKPAIDKKFTPKGVKNEEYTIGTIVEMKKGHPCGANEWKIIRLGADIKIECLNCNRVVMLPRIEFDKKIKKIKG